MIRTSLFLPEALHQELIITSKREGKSLARLVRDLLGRTLATHRNASIKRMYAALKTLKGKGNRHITDASLSIDETLYGEHGAWKGARV